MMTRADGRAQRRALMRQIAQHEKEKKRAHLHALREAIVAARDAHKRAVVHAVERCRNARAEARSKAAHLRAEALEELTRAVELERQAARSHCETARKAARGEKDRKKRARDELRAEQAFGRQMRLIERSAKLRHRDLAPKKRRGEKQSESDDEVRGNIPPELVPLFNKVKSVIRPSSRHSRTEAFLEYAEARPREVLQVLEDRTEALIRDLERRERAASRAMKTPLTRAELADLVPF